MLPRFQRKISLISFVGLWIGVCRGVAGDSPPLPSPPLFASLRPAIHEASVCSWRYPVCVHGGQSTHQRLFVLDAVEQAWATATGSLELPPPDSDPSRGVYDLYLVQPEPQDRRESWTEADQETSLGGLDRRSTFAVLRHDLPQETLRMRVVEELFRAVLWRVSPATDPSTAAAQSSAFASLVLPTSPALEEEIACFQATPERALIDLENEEAFNTEETARGASLFYTWLDTAFGASPGALLSSLWALTATHTDFASTPTAPPPTTFAVLRATFSGGRLSFDEVLTRFGLARPFLQATTWNPPKTPFLDITPAWEIAWPDRARRLASPTSLPPTGSSYVVVHTKGMNPGGRLRVEVTWEEHARMRWTALKLDKTGKVFGEVAMHAAPKATEVQATLAELDRAESVLLVATNLGDYTPFDPPPHTSLEPHAWLLTVAAQ